MAGKMEARLKIVDVAMSLIGSHYLWGATGATPYVACGSPYWVDVKDPHTNQVTKELTSIPVKVARPSLSPFAPCVNAAQCDADTPHVCAGRFRKAGGSIIKDAMDFELLTFLGYCEQVGGDVRYVNTDEPTGWTSLFAPRLTPRVIIGKKIQDTNGNIISGIPVWGEDCSQKRHFDCLGFISYVLNQATRKYFNPRVPWAGAISDYFNDPYHLSEEIALTDEPVPGDIVFRGDLDKDHPNNSKWHHIGFIGRQGKVVQAEMAVTGVHADADYNHGATWTARRRLKDAQLP
jgi:cell wall-associated NlpC family hydrolase